MFKHSAFEDNDAHLFFGIWPRVASLPASSLTPVTHMQELQEILIRVLWDMILKPVLS